MGSPGGIEGAGVPEPESIQASSENGIDSPEGVAGGILASGVPDPESIQVSGENDLDSPEGVAGASSGQIVDLESVAGGVAGGIEGAGVAGPESKRVSGENVLDSDGETGGACITKGDSPNIPQIVEKSLADSVPYSVRVHSHLAQIIVSEKEFTRAYALWATLRAGGHHSGHIDKQSVIDLAMGQTGKGQSTVYSWLALGEGIFWTSSGGRLWLRGKHLVFDYFLGDGVQPGAVVLVPAELLLTSKLHRVRASLSSTWLTRDGGKIAARITRRNVFQGVPERTQQTYDRTAGVKIRPLSVRSQTQKKQLSNQYFRPDNLTTLGIKKPSRANFHGYRATEFNAVVNAQMSVVANGNGHKFGGLRQYFNDAKRAVAVAEYRKENEISIPVYWLAPDDRLQKSSGPAVRVTWLW